MFHSSFKAKKQLSCKGNKNINIKSVNNSVKTLLRQGWVALIVFLYFISYLLYPEMNSSLEIWLSHNVFICFLIILDIFGGAKYEFENGKFADMLLFLGG